MGLFDFVKEAGAKMFGGGKEAEERDERAKAQALTQQIQTLGFKIDDLHVAFDDGLATLRGTAPSQAEREKAILVTGNTQGVARVDDQIRVVKPEPEAKMYTVKSGDSLSKIAKEYYGNAMKYPVIFEANKPMLKDPDKIYPGQVLRIPPIEK